MPAGYLGFSFATPFRMNIIALGCAGFLFCAAFQHRINAFFLHLWDRGKKYFQTPRNETDENLFIVSSLLSSLQVGVSIEACLEGLLRENCLGDKSKQKIASVLAGKPGPDFLSTLLGGAIMHGQPVHKTLSALQKILQAEKRIHLRSYSITSQSRAQGSVLSFLPLFMLLALAVLDPEWLRSALKDPTSWCLWAFASALVGLGQLWMKQILDSSLRAKNAEEKIRQEALPPLLLGILSQMAIGRDAETARDKTMDQLPKELAHLLRKNPGGAVAQLHYLIAQSKETGAPLFENLSNLLTNNYLETENRWEEKVQRLPVFMLAPLFTCFFPATLLVILAMLLPLLEGIL